jgi:hypothetical protein
MGGIKKCTTATLDVIDAQIPVKSPKGVKGVTKMYLTEWYP